MPDLPTAEALEKVPGSGKFPLVLVVADKSGIPGNVLNCNPEAARVMSGPHSFLITDPAAAKVGLMGSPLCSACIQPAEPRGLVSPCHVDISEGLVELKSLPFVIAACIEAHMTGQAQTVAAVHLKKDSKAASFGRRLIVAQGIRHDGPANEFVLTLGPPLKPPSPCTSGGEQPAAVDESSPPNESVLSKGDVAAVESEDTVEVLPGQSETGNI